MGSWSEALERLRIFRAEHPEVIVTYPSEPLSGLWEVSLPGASAMGFDNAELMMKALEGIYP